MRVDRDAQVVVGPQKIYFTVGDIIIAYRLTKIKPKGKKFFKNREFVTTEQPEIGEGAARIGFNVRDVFEIKAWTKGGAQMM
ncbi:hypothetical protein KJ359_001907 [Pestalotiopsis sp. 9143b]|nr:hypothetical protein KJ359_001907 [Pestalotiopsis sp. 9143b]